MIYNTMLFPAGSIGQTFAEFFVKLYESVATHSYWKLYLEGFANTIIMTSISLVLGVIIGVLIAVVKYVNHSTGKLRVLTAIANVYTTVIRGTPVMIQMLIIYYMIFKNVPPELKIFVAALAFGVNSGAYVSEIVRGGILAVDKGQTEAGRSLGLSSGKTMRLIVLPQAIRGILPSLFNELIALVKETSVAGYISIMDITNAGDLVRSRTWNFHPLIVSALMYLAIVMILTKVQSVMERRLASGDRD